MPTVLITGANRGIGLQFARDYAAAGWDVIGTSRNPDRADDLRAISGATVMRLSVANPHSVDNFFDELGDRQVDLFISNAGSYGSRDLDKDSWIETLEINTIAPTVMATQLKKNMEQSDVKKMVVLSSQMGSVSDNQSGGSIIYRSSKAAVNAAWKSLSIDFRDDGIAIGILHPGWVKTEMGGENALINTETSVAGMMQVIENLSLENSGEFRVYDGSKMGW
ncbi:SDR family oxidoreductase [Sphingorhabdus sp. Alg239-R122]|uniref:SDR family oxidoreductase n=1 Tax=Sphingorhabdus sp. Alg239-R122 TaxID=2305989 RepID=UPI0013D8F11E|nr:SDR family oxidoreductase [Sphingorhabdus sp. Alg239-R122]